MSTNNKYPKDNHITNWDDIIKKEAIGNKGLDIGEVQAIKGEYIITEKGLLNKKIYCIPISTIESFDGDVLRVNVDETDLTNYEPIEEQEEVGNKVAFESSQSTQESETTIPLTEENLEVTKKIIEDNIEIVKVPIKEKKKLEIDLIHEEVLIEKRSIQGENSFNNVS